MLVPLVLVPVQSSSGLVAPLLELEAVSVSSQLVVCHVVLLALELVEEVPCGSPLKHNFRILRLLISTWTFSLNLFHMTVFHVVVQELTGKVLFQLAVYLAVSFVVVAVVQLLY
jgi:hypothetical protein